MSRVKNWKSIEFEFEGKNKKIPPLWNSSELDVHFICNLRAKIWVKIMITFVVLCSVKKYLKFPLLAVRCSHSYFFRLEVVAIANDKNVRTDKVTKWRYTRNINLLTIFQWQNLHSATPLQSLNLNSGMNSRLMKMGNIYEMLKLEKLLLATNLRMSKIVDVRRRSEKDIEQFHLYEFEFVSCFHGTTQSINHRLSEWRKVSQSISRLSVCSDQFRLSWKIWKINIEKSTNIVLLLLLWPNFLLSHPNTFSKLIRNFSQFITCWNLDMQTC